MKHLLLIIALLGLTTACASSKKAKQNSSNSIQKEKIDSFHQQIPPGTCSLNITECKILNENNEFWLTGNVEHIIGYGAGFTTILNKDQFIKIRLTNQQTEEVKNLRNVACSVKEINQLNKPQILELIDIRE